MSDATDGTASASAALVDVLITSAFGPELAALELPLGSVTQIGQREGHRGLSVLVAPSGIGPLAAAAGAATLLAGPARTARLVVFVGTAGVFPNARARDRFPIGSCAAVSRTTLVDLAAARGLAARPEVQVASFELDTRFGGETSVATTQAITIDDDLAREIGELGFDLENLELAGVASACALAKVPLAAVLGISNLVGKSGRAEWAKFHAVAASAAATRVMAALRTHAEGR